MKISAFLFTLYIAFNASSVSSQEVIYVPVYYHASVDQYMPVEQQKQVRAVKEEEPDYYWGN